jgi:hypothetical protein
MKTLQIMFAVAVLAGAGSLQAADKAGEDTASTPAARTSTDSNSAFVNHLFEDLYGRQASTGELSGYVEDLKTGDITFPRVAARLFQAPEFHDNAAFVAKLYISLLNRDPEFHQWAQILKVMRTNGATQADATTAFVNSPEFAAAFPQSMSDAAMAAKLFQQMFDRAPEAAELERLASKLSQGATRRELVDELLRSPELESHIANRINATLVYLAFLHHTPKTDDISSMTESLAGGLSIADAINSILLSPEYAATLK